MIKKLTFGAALLAASVSAFASNWVTVGYGTVSNQALDTSSMKRAGNIVTIWEQIKYFTPDATFKDGVPTASISVLRQFNCAESTAAMRSYVRYAVDGATIQSGRADGAFTDVVPDSVDEALLKYVCH